MEPAVFTSDTMTNASSMYVDTAFTYPSLNGMLLNCSNFRNNGLRTSSYRRRDSGETLMDHVCKEKRFQYVVIYFDHRAGTAVYYSNPTSKIGPNLSDFRTASR